MISIIIPSYNQQEYLPDAIESALAQRGYVDGSTWTTPEVIVVDDGSTDNSADIARKYPVRLIRQVNKGLPSARNTGIMNARGDYVLFLDADDILLDSCAEYLHKTALETGADVVAPSFKTFGTTNEQVILMPEPTLEDFKSGNRVGYCALFKKETLLEVGGYSPRMVHGYEDLHLTINLLSLRKKLITVPEILWLYRTKEHSMIHDAQQHHAELMAQIYKDFPHAYA